MSAVSPTHAPRPSNAKPFWNWETFYHPASGAIILGIDLLAFGGDAVMGFLDVFFVAFAAFAATFAGVWFVQRKLSRNTAPAAFWKAFLGAFLAGIPLPITGTLFGTAILFLSGLHHLKLRAGLKGLEFLKNRVKG
jgi:hypothetical protein